MNAELTGELLVTGPAQAAAWRAKQVADPEQVRDDLWALALPIPGGSLPSSFGYALLGEDGVHIIDPGWGSSDVLEYWRVFLESQGRRLTDVATLLVTHSHPDHLGLAGRLRDISGAELVMSATESMILNDVPLGSAAADERALNEFLRWGVPDGPREELIAKLATTLFSTPIDADRFIADGDELVLAGHQLRVQATPGHTDGHLCLEDLSADVLFTGDHVLPQINPGIGFGHLPNTDPLGDYLRSLRRIAQLDHCEVLPGHEYRFRGLRVRCEQIAAHQLRRTAAVRDVVQRIGEASIWDLTRNMPWTRGFENMRDFELQSAMRQTELHFKMVQSGEAEEWLRGSVASHAE